jgi:hypothetical protein
MSASLLNVCGTFVERLWNVCGTFVERLLLYSTGLTLHWTCSSCLKSVNTNCALVLAHPTQKNPQIIICILSAHLLWSALPIGARFICVLIFWRRSNSIFFILYILLYSISISPSFLQLSLSPTISYIIHLPHQLSLSYHLYHQLYP